MNIVCSKVTFSLTFNFPLILHSSLYFCPQPTTSASTVNVPTTAPLSTLCVGNQTRSKAHSQPSCQTSTWPNAKPGETPGGALTTNARKQSEGKKNMENISSQLLYFLR